MRNKFKKSGIIVAALGCVLAMGLTAQAGTISFTVSVNGDHADPLSKREIKADDGDPYAYFTGVRYTVGNSPVSVSSYKLNNKGINTSSAVLKLENLGTTLSRKYNTKAPGGDYYFMEAGQTPAYPKTTLTGRYCP